MIANPRTSQCGEAPTSPRWMKIKPVTLCGYSGYQPKLEACFVDLEALRNTVFQQHCWKIAESITVWRDSPSVFIRLLYSGSFSDWLSLSHCSVKWFHSRNICPIAVLNGFTVVIFAAVTKLINNSATIEKIAVFTNKHTADIPTH